MVVICGRHHMNSIRVSMCVVDWEIFILSIAYSRSGGSWTSEESINVNNILKETPFGVRVLLGAKVVIDSNVNFLSHLDSLLLCCTLLPSGWTYPDQCHICASILLLLWSIWCFLSTCICMLLCGSSLFCSCSLPCIFQVAFISYLDWLWVYER